MRVVSTLRAKVHHLAPGSFAMVMATGIVSIDLNQHALPRLALGLLLLNAVAWLWLSALSIWRALAFPRAVLADFMAPGRGATFLTLPAATCVLGSQCVLVKPLPILAASLLVLGALQWLALIYLFFVATITRRIKPGFTRSINGAWLVAVVSTQALAVLAIVCAQDAGDGQTWLLFGGLCLYLLGAALYLLIITLVVYRMVFFPMRAREFTPPYWIDMGALAITCLAGSLFVLAVPANHALAELVPFVKGFSLFFWATASWWIPLLLMLELWRHGWRHVPLVYNIDNWDIVFPLAMYTVGTFAMAHALRLDFLLVIPRVGVYISALVWLLAAVGLGRSLLTSHHLPP